MHSERGEHDPLVCLALLGLERKKVDSGQLCAFYRITTKAIRNGLGEFLRNKAFAILFCDHCMMLCPQPLAGGTLALQAFPA
jgi:hypothetical protein